MFPITTNALAALKRNVPLTVTITVEPPSGSNYTITNESVISNTFEIDRYSCTGDLYEIGSAIAAELKFSLYNADHAYDSKTF